VRGLRRRRAALAAVAAALAAVVVVAGVVRTRIRDEREAALAAMRDVARMSLEAALRLRRAGDVPGMRQSLPKLLHAYQDLQQRSANTPEVEYLLGRMYRALMDEDQALQHQERALADDPSFAPSLYERAVLLSKRYGWELDRALSQPPEGGGERTIAQVERARPDLVRLRE